MRNDEIANKISTCHKNGIRIYPIPIGSKYYKLVIARATKYRWSDLPKDKRSGYEEVDKVIYSLQIGDTLYKTEPTMKDEKWFEKINELYLHLFDKLNLNK